MQKKILIISGVVILIAGMVGAWFYFTRSSTPVADTPTADLFDTTAETDVQPAQNITAEMPELPDVVARVNGTEIKKAELEATEMQILSSQGIDPTTLTLENRQQLRAQALDNLVSNALVKQAAATAGVTAEEADIDAQIEVIKGQFEDITKFQEALTQQGITEADLRGLVASDVTVQKYLENTLNLKSIEVTEEEVTAIYAQEVASSTQEIPPLEEIHDQFKGFIVQQRQQALVGAHIKELSTKAQIEVLI
ncbi:MAG: SurA N-terminal domain-containing protein [Patescibacteria group bacterium]|nr:SurA N-terminal domain-containing protein [Patescibacteria group bacterium]